MSDRVGEREERVPREIAQNDFTWRCRDVLCLRKNYGPALERFQIVEIIRGDSSSRLISPLPLLAPFREISSLGDAIAVSEKRAGRKIMRVVVRNSAGEHDAT